MPIQIRSATREDCLDIARLGLIAGDGIPAFFWAGSQQPGQSIEEAGAVRAGDENAGFSFSNAWLAILDNEVAGMLLAYRLAGAETDQNLEGVQDFIRPMLELERLIPGSFYVNMLATYPRFRQRGVGRALMAKAMHEAVTQDCRECSLIMFEANTEALGLYRALGYEISGRRPLVEHACHPYTQGDIIVMTCLADKR